MINLKKVGRLLSLVLRHDPGKIGITLDAGGWVDIDDLMVGIARHMNVISLDELKEIVETNNKQRFTFSEDGLKIRANQGHSIEVDLDLEEQVPPALLFHGTATKDLAIIKWSGIKKMTRQHVHLSETINTAVTVGSRHGEAYVLFVNAEAMYDDGCKFYKSKNGVWLTDFVDKKYLASDTGEVF